MMNLDFALEELKKLSDPRAKENWIRFGIHTTDEYWGCPITKMKDLAKVLKKSHEVSLQLWDAKVHDAKLLACFIEESKKVTQLQIDSQLKDIISPDLASRWAEHMVAPTPLALDFIEKNKKHKLPYPRVVAFNVLKELLKAKKNIPSDTLLSDCLSQISHNLQEEDNWVKEAMNYSLMYFGKASDTWRINALQVAQSIGKVEVDYGDTSCITMDASAFLQR